ncbi:MmcQ/YjbR family DNA-binding protein [Tomitella fengzijianii]|uniref:MmcQ/YjbR family DNA-binding protein n=1 Tax=Tomitella fengzijianii TaxID=2597660 RepID=A0A516X6V5_9ACTN|nr:MmcQ/YjbR family DNA-binding protein [Tomitella fengzijianii]QDQ98743.1 MmcQ/YjbR family DNA-binding protein [Tomitella fengzijianii]
MPHPIMFDDGDPVLARVRAVALALPGAAEKISHGRPNFFTVKVFATYSGSLRAGDGRRFPQSILVKPDEGEFPALLQHPRYYEPKYMAPYGWIGIDLAPGDAPPVDWDEVAELLDMSYRMTAPAKLIRELDGRG